MQGYYQFKVDLLMQLGRGEEAFATSEAARGRTLLELLSESGVALRQGADPKLLTQEKQIRQNLQAIEARRIQILSQEHTLQQAEAIDAESDSLLRQIDQVTAQIRTTSPAAADLLQPKPLNLAQIRQQVLDPDTVLVQYSLDQDRSYLWIVSPSQFKSYTLPKRAEIDKAAKTFLSAISIAPGITSDIKRTGDTLLPLILPELPDWTAGKRLLLVGDGILQTLPFAALPLPNQTEYIPLLRDHEILSQPSASAIAISRQQLKDRRPAPKTLAILADPVYRADDPRVAQQAAASPAAASPESRQIAVAQRPDSQPIELTRTLRDLDLTAITALPGTRTEADLISELVPDAQRTVAYDFDANYAWATNPQLSQYQIVHFATHGFINPTNPELSGIVLALVNRQGQTLNEGFLRLHDIFNLSLPAELVVLSACQTGLGAEVSGEGLIGLTRGLMYAGAKRVAVSLWNVNDRGTAELMANFYKNMLQDNLSPAAALRAAQLAAWQDKKSPYLWAAFTVQVEWN